MNLSEAHKAAREVRAERRADVEGSGEDRGGVGETVKVNGGDGVDGLGLPLGGVAAVDPGVEVGGVASSEEAHPSVIQALDFVLVVEADDGGDEGDVNLQSRIKSNNGSKSRLT